jgi:hypothetical protein
VVVRVLVLAVALAAVLSGCVANDAGPTLATGVPPSQAIGPSISSEDFADGDPWPESALASAFGGQCSGDNVSPQLSWSGLPDGTVVIALSITDLDANGFVHAIQANIPADVTSVSAGGWDSLPGVSVAHDAGGVGYFGPCPPSGVHRYDVQVFATDSVLDLEEGFTFDDLVDEVDRYALGSGSTYGVVDAG